YSAPTTTRSQLTVACHDHGRLGDLPCSHGESLARRSISQWNRRHSSQRSENLKRATWNSVAYANFAEGSACTRALSATLNLGEPALARVRSMSAASSCGDQGFEPSGSDPKLSTQQLSPGSRVAVFIDSNRRGGDGLGPAFGCGARAGN